MKPKNPSKREKITKYNRDSLKKAIHASNEAGMHSFRAFITLLKFFKFTYFMMIIDKGLLFFSDSLDSYFDPYIKKSFLDFVYNLMAYTLTVEIINVLKAESLTRNNYIVGRLNIQNLIGRKIKENELTQHPRAYAKSKPDIMPPNHQLTKEQPLYLPLYIGKEEFETFPKIFLELKQENEILKVFNRIQELLSISFLQIEKQKSRHSLKEVDILDSDLKSYKKKSHFLIHEANYLDKSFEIYYALFQSKLEQHQFDFAQKNRQLKAIMDSYLSIYRELSQLLKNISQISTTLKTDLKKYESTKRRGGSLSLGPTHLKDTKFKKEKRPIQKTLQKEAYKVPDKFSPLVSDRKEVQREPSEKRRHSTHSRDLALFIFDPKLPKLSDYIEIDLEENVKQIEEINHLEKMIQSSDYKFEFLRELIAERNALLGTCARIMENYLKLNKPFFPKSIAQNFRNAIFHGTELFSSAGTNFKGNVNLNESIRMMAIEILAFIKKYPSKSKQIPIEHTVLQEINSDLFLKIVSFKIQDPSFSQCQVQLALGKYELESFEQIYRDSTRQFPEALMDAAIGFSYARIGAYIKEVKTRFQDQELASKLILMYEEFIEPGKDFRHGRKYGLIKS